MHITTRITPLLLPGLVSACLSLPPQPPGPEQAPPTSRPPPEQPTKETPSDAHRYGLTVSGGISLGAYEAGLNWALVRGLRARRYEASELGPPATLTAVTGASAGNINALLTAISWCKVEDEEVDDNIFEQTWLDVGFERLAPESLSCSEFQEKFDPAAECKTDDVYDPDDGLLTRKALVAAERHVIATLAQGHFIKTCELPFGVTVSKETPVMTNLGKNGTHKIPTQRLAVLLQARPTSDGSSLRIQQFDRQGLAPEALFGEILRLPTAGGAVPDNTLMAVVEASSAFPIAFGPVKLHYCKPTDGPTSCTGLGKFFDGGLFDNLPIGIAMGLSGLSGRILFDPVQAEVLAGDPSLAPEFLYIDSDVVRAARPTAEIDDKKSAGWPLITSLLGNFVNVSRKYELQMLARANIPEGTARLTPVTRLVPIMGQHLAAFGAFVAKPFRQHDYYVGVYDGIYALADRRCEALKDRQGSVDEMHEQCIALTVRAFHDRLGLDGTSQGPRTASAVVRKLLRRELLRAMGSREAAESVLRRTKQLAWATEKVEGPDPWILELLEANLRLDDEMHDLRREPRDLDIAAFDQVVREVQESFSKDDSLSKSDRAFFADPDHWIQQLVKRLSIRALAVSERDGDDTGKKIFGGAGFLVHTLSEPPREFYGNATTIPHGGGLWWRMLLPYEVTARIPGGVELGLRVNRYFTSGMGMTLALRPLSCFDGTWCSDASAVGGRVGLGFLKMFHVAGIPSPLDIGGYARVLYTTPTDVENRVSGGLELGFQPFRYLRVSTELDLVNLVNGAPHSWSVRLGLADIPSLIYWGVRSF
ncbi:patatin-like phospholipase family protein [Polyangium sorediatum]|uniref:Patatin-like phospholipase family protein n=1 Tax=Polyangium sorediatum TaxID=889274 RepID=A0ABT6NQU8_9BACT|nr:patatin-like phospholipase family protein [Polyangium sorediatum]MDI1430684.1 patatin-like phospholipase family protein [Polyangium sorediatum]